MWKWLDSVGEFAVSNARVIRDAWAAFLVWCLIAAGGLWWLEGQVYEVRLTNSQSTASSLTTQLSGARTEIQDLRAQLAARPDRPDRWTLAYPDVADEQLMTLAAKLKNIIPAGQTVFVGFVDNPSAVSLSVKLSKALREVGIFVNNYPTNEDDPQGHGISLFVGDEKNLSLKEKEYIDAFRLSGFVIQVRGIGDDLPAGVAFAVVFSFPR